MTTRLLLLSCILLSGCAHRTTPISVSASKTVDMQIVHSAATLSQTQFSLHQTGNYAVRPVSPADRSSSTLSK